MHGTSRHHGCKLATFILKAKLNHLNLMDRKNTLYNKQIPRSMLLKKITDQLIWRQLRSSNEKLSASLIDGLLCGGSANTSKQNGAHTFSSNTTQKLIKKNVLNTFLNNRLSPS